MTILSIKIKTGITFSCSVQCIITDIFGSGVKVQVTGQVIGHPKASPNLTLKLILTLRLTLMLGLGLALELG